MPDGCGVVVVVVVVVVVLGGCCCLERGRLEELWLTSREPQEAKVERLRGAGHEATLHVRLAAGIAVAQAEGMRRHEPALWSWLRSK
jgi:hypothetical protein